MSLTNFPRMIDCMNPRRARVIDHPKLTAMIFTGLQPSLSGYRKNVGNATPLFLTLATTVLKDPGPFAAGVLKMRLCRCTLMPRIPPMRLSALESRG